MPFFGLTTVLAIIAIVHVIKTERSQLWIMALLGIPGLGVLAYIVVEVLPEYFHGRKGHKVSKKIEKILNPDHLLDQAKREYAISDTAKNACNLADRYVEKEQYTDASVLYRDALVGVNEFNPDIIHKLAVAEFGLDNFNDTRSLLEQLIEKNPEYRNQDAHLLYARALEALEQTELATEEYEALIKYYSGPEPSYRYGLMLAKQGNRIGAQELFKAIIEKAQLSPKHYRKMHQEWISRSQNEIND